MTTEFKNNIKHLNEAFKAQKAAEKRQMEVRNNREYDAAKMDEYIAMLDMRSALQEMCRQIEIAIECQEETMTAQQIFEAYDKRCGL